MEPKEGMTSRRPRATAMKTGRMKSRHHSVTRTGLGQGSKS